MKINTSLVTYLLVGLVVGAIVVGIWDTHRSTPLLSPLFSNSSTK